MPVVEPMMAHDAGSHTPFSGASMNVRLRNTPQLVWHRFGDRHRMKAHKLREDRLREDKEGVHGAEL